MRHNEGMLFKDWQWGESLDYLSKVLHYTESIILVSGQPNSGKTTLKQEVINSLPNSNFKIFTVFAEHKTTVAAFMQQVHLGFDLVWDQHLPPDWEELQRSVINNQDHNWILLIDDAEKLSWDILNSLIDLYINLSSEQTNFHLVLFARDCFLDSIRNSQLRDFFEVKFDTIYLKPLGLEEMTVFLSDVMQLDFDRQTLKKIYRASNGIIGKVKQLAITENNIKRTEKRFILGILLESVINPSFIRLVVCGFLLFIAYIVFNFTQKQYKTVEVVAKINKESSIITSHDSVDSRDHVNSTGNTDSINSIDTRDTTDGDDKMRVMDIYNNYHATTDGDQSNVDTSIAVDFNKLEGYINKYQQSQYEQLYQKLYLDLKNNLQKKLIDLETQIIQLQKHNQNLKKNIQQNRQNNLLLGSNVITNTIKNNNLLKLNDNQQLLNSSKNFYVLQLMASKNEGSIIKLINNYPKLFNKIKYFSGKFKSTEDVWYIAIYGQYNDPGSAIGDLKNLPPELRRLKPLVRDYNSLKKLINNKGKNE